MTLRSGSDHSEKCRWYTLVNEFMSDRAHVVTQAHASTTNPDGPNFGTPSDTNNTDHKSGESTSKSPEPKRKDDILIEKCIGEFRESSKTLMDRLTASDDMKTSLILSMQQTMTKLVEKL